MTKLIHFSISLLTFFETKSYHVTGWSGPHSVGKVGLELTEVHMTLPPECQD